MSEAAGPREAWTAGTWHCWLDLAPRPGALNMALDLALLDRARRGERWLRLYTWSPHCLSFGRHERATRRYDADRIGRRRLAVVRRPTGGRAVWHARELTYAVAAPVAGLGDLGAAYLEIHRMLLAALGSLGAGAALAPRGAVPSLDAGACFARPVGGEVLCAGRKVVGSAQLREADALLQHGSILLEDDQSLVADVSRGIPPADGSAPLSRLLGRRIEAEEAAGAVCTAAAARWAARWVRHERRADLMAEAAAHLPRFTSPAWTWRA